MNHDDLVGVFKYGLTRLHVDDHGLTDDNDLGDMNAVAMLARAIKTTVTASGDTLEQLLLHRLACLTEDLLVTPWLHTDNPITRDWLTARAELLQAEIPGT